MPIPLPKKPRCVQKDGFKAVMEIENLYPGYGMTIGNTLRRVFLSSLGGAAVTLVKIQGVSHEFSTIPHVAEDVVQILLNLKQLRFKAHTDEPQKAHIKAHGEREVTGKDIETSSQMEIANPSLHIATLTDKKASLDIEMTVEKGFGYVQTEAMKKEKLEIGAMALDAIFTPIRKINYEVENMRVGDRTDFDRLRVSIETDGTIDPEEAFSKAAQIVVSQFQELVSPETESQSAPKSSAEREMPAAEGSNANALLSDLGLSPRVMHTLEANSIATAQDLAQKTQEEISEFEGMGNKGVTEIKKALKKLKLTLKEK